MTTQKVQRRDVMAAQRLELALKLRASKMTYEEVAKQAGYADRGSCYNAIQRELSRCVPEGIEEYRREELAMLDTMHREVWAIFIDKKHKHRLFAADRLLAISQARCRLLGLNQENDGNVAAACTIIREVPSGYLGEPIASATPVLPSPTSEVSE